jgi:hypothetical protein
MCGTEKRPVRFHTFSEFCALEKFGGAGALSSIIYFGMYFQQITKIYPTM